MSLRCLACGFSGDATSEGLPGIKCTVCDLRSTVKSLEEQLAGAKDEIDVLGGAVEMGTSLVKGIRAFYGSGFLPEDFADELIAFEKVILGQGGKA